MNEKHTIVEKTILTDIEIIILPTICRAKWQMLHL